MSKEGSVLAKSFAFLFIFLAIRAGAVAAQDCKDGIRRTAPSDRYIVSEVGYVLDKLSNLMWKRCSEGQNYNAQSGWCDGQAIGLTWQDALLRAQQINTGDIEGGMSFDNWRLPNVKELASLAEYACIGPAINEYIFPNTPPWSNGYWSSSTWSWKRANEAWKIYFYNGVDRYDRKDNGGKVRYVRNNLEKGDSNESGAIDVGDALLCIRLALGQIQPIPELLYTCDVGPKMNGVASSDGTVDLTDILVISEILNREGP